jgi:hypothetical protein
VGQQGKRDTHNANYDGTTRMADPEVVWKRYKEEACSIRMLHPQRWCDPLWCAGPLRIPLSPCLEVQTYKLDTRGIE